MEKYKLEKYSFDYFQIVLNTIWKITVWKIQLGKLQFGNTGKQTFNFPQSIYVLQIYKSIWISPISAKNILEYVVRVTRLMYIGITASHIGNAPKNPKLSEQYKWTTFNECTLSNFTVQHKYDGIFWLKLCSNTGSFLFQMYFGHLGEL